MLSKNYFLQFPRNILTQIVIGSDTGVGWRGFGQGVLSKNADTIDAGKEGSGSLLIISHKGMMGES